MNDYPQRKEPENDALALLTEAFADLSVPSGPPPAVQQRLLATLEQLPARPAAILSPQVRKGANMRQALSAALFLIAVTAVAATWIPRPGGAGNAFAAMLHQIQEIRTVSFEMSVDIKGAHEATSLKCKMTAIDPDWLRAEMLQGELRSIKITNYPEQKTLLLFPETKQALLQPLQGNAARLGTNYVERLRNLQPEHAKFVGDDAIDGHPALKYDYQHRGDFYTLWLDAATKLPVRIEYANKQDAAQTDVRTTMSNFVWNATVDEAEFSLEPPAGYEMMAPNALGGAPPRE